jgi:Fe-S cluster assembly protein SufD
MNLLTTYDSFNRAHPASDILADGKLAQFRQAAFNYATTHGLPTRQNEDWHYTSVKVLNEVQFMPSVFNLMEPSSETAIQIKANLNTAFTNLVFFNGTLNKSLSSDLPLGIIIHENFNASEITSTFHDTFEALNAAYMIKPFIINVAKETIVDKPVNIMFFTSVEGGPALMVHPHVRFVVGERSSVKILESHYGKNGVSYFVNSFFDLQLNENSKATYSRIQSDSENAINIGRTQISLQKMAHLESLSFATGAGLSRHSLEVTLKGQGAYADVLGVYVARDSQHIDNTTVIDHQVGDCNTYQLYKGLIDGQAKAVFCGKVIIRKDAQKANSSQLNNNLLLSSKAEADSKPSLEIYADDVKASHGSTVGQMNSEELFYLLSRAIPKPKAITMLSYGFLSEVIYKVSNPEIQSWLSKHLETAFAKIHLESAK